MNGFLTTTPIEGGFQNPPLAAQAVFRALMDAMARPGTVHPVAALALPPAPLTSTAASVALTLCDHDTPLWLDARLDVSTDVRGWLGFHCGAPLTTIPADAHFVLASSPGELMALENFAQGSQEYPDRSTTLILQVDTLTKGRELHLEGPGIETSAALSPFPLPRHFAAQWKQNRARFPRGVDLILAAPDAISCLPRTTRIFETEA
ncbi:phosphonate C-P lyase system protein PhnH [Aquibium carbonis]|uniref:Phosphonate C-P lyase system protein PhnH n=1 Tax=Aquibium carbonis TaxID=2495581 RepID=A0A3R9Y906_9HYPH|nr:phosphonate C-P lyase system protein PhnH [Aquibium carbonis]RST86813.1 phosphonate C-P lyase system protein PhnH [Aquibium carbonis]